jgi:branched-chain amino acid transport system substrate-binding protein
VRWTYDTFALAHGTAKAITKSGGDSWFFITADYAFGYAMERDAGDVVRLEGGKVLGSVKVPLGTFDFSRYCKRKHREQGSLLLPPRDKT